MLRQLLIACMTRKQKIKFILRKEKSFTEKDFESCSEKAIFKIACMIEERQKGIDAPPKYFKFSDE